MVGCKTCIKKRKRTKFLDKTGLLVQQFKTLLRRYAKTKLGQSLKISSSTVRYLNFFSSSCEVHDINIFNLIRAVS